MGAPVGYTCPDIDKIVKKLDQQMRWIRRFNDWEDKKYVEGMLDECYDVMDDAIGEFESLRKDNDSLRKWAQEMEQEAETAIVQYEQLQEKLNQQQ